MLLTFDLDACQLIQAPGYQTPISGLEAKRGDGEHLQIQFVRAGMLVQLPGASEVTFMVKRWNDFNGAALAESGAMTWEPVLQRYEGTINYNATTLNSMMLIGAGGSGKENASTNELMCEAAWRPSAAVTFTRSTNPVRLKLHNNVLRGNEAPVEGGTGTELDTGNYLTKDRVIEYLPLVTGLTGGGVGNLDGLASTSVNRSLNSAVAIIDNTAGVDMFRVYELVSGNTAESAPTVIRPDDYNALSNARVWRLRSTLNNFDSAAYLSQDEAINWSGSMGLTGGSGKLDGIPTAGVLQTNLVIAFIDSLASEPSNCLRIYRLTAGTQAELAPFVIRPDDYHATTNARYWSLLSAPNVFHASNYWQKTIALGVAADGLTGGNTLTPSAVPSLDGIPTANGAVRTDTMVIAHYLSAGLRTWSIYQLVAGTDAESVPNVVRPDDYHATTNARVWKRQRPQGIPDIVPAPSTSNASGQVGQIAISASYIYVCVATNSWRRAALSTW